MRKRSLLILILLILSLSLAACGQNSDGTEEPASSEKPVTLKFYVSGLTFTDTEFNTMIAEPVKKKFPHITLEKVVTPEGQKIDNLVSAGTVPDIIYASAGSYYNFKRLGILQSLDEYVDKYKLDLNRIKPDILNSIKAYAEDGEIYTIPFNSNETILYYNKDIFDKFGVPYPPDEQITWEEALAIGQQLTQTKDGVNYIGLEVAAGPAYIQSSLALGTLDPKTGKAIVNTPEWEKAFTFLKKTFEVSGYIQGDTYLYNKDAFLKDQILAMRPTYLANMVGPLEELRKQGEIINWDIAPVPNFKEALGTSKEVNIHSLFISKTSEHKDEAFQVLNYILSDEVQRVLSRNGRVPSIVNPELEKEFGADIEALKGKKIENIFKAKSVQLHAPHEFEGDVSKFVTDAAKELALSGIDVNTALRTLEEKINQEVDRLEKTTK